MSAPRVPMLSGRQRGCAVKELVNVALRLTVQYYQKLLNEMAGFFTKTNLNAEVALVA